MASRFKHLSATGAVSAVSINLKSIILTAGSDAATVTIKDDDAGSGNTIAVLKAAANTTAVWTSGDRQGVVLTAAHATLAGTGPVVSCEIE